MLAKKLRIPENAEVVVINPPDNYLKSLGKLPKGVIIKQRLKSKNDFIHLFVKNKAHLEKNIFKASASLNDAGLMWISYPKISSGMQSDLTRDKGWECLEKIKMKWASLISFDENWSAFLLKNEAPAPQSKASKDYHDNANAFADPKTKTVIIPDDLGTAFKKNKNAAAIYNALAYSHRKEYVLWIVSAKRDETRKARVEKTVQMLLKGKKNPTDK